MNNKITNLKKINNIAVTCVIAGYASSASAWVNDDHGGQWSIYAPIHATSLGIDVDALDAPIHAGVSTLFKASTAFFPLGVSWQGERWSHSIEGWHGEYNPLNNFDTSIDMSFNDSVDIGQNLDNFDGEIQIKGDIDGEAKAEMLQRIIEYRAGYAFYRGNKLAINIIGGVKAYRQDASLSVGLAVDAEVGVSVGLCVINCNNPLPIYNESVDLKPFNLKYTPDPLNSSWVELVAGLQVDYRPYDNLGFILSHVMGVYNGQSVQTDIKSRYDFNSNFFAELGMRYHSFDSNGIGITQNGGFISAGYHW